MSVPGIESIEHLKSEGVEIAKSLTCLGAVSRARVTHDLSIKQEVNLTGIIDLDVNLYSRILNVLAERASFFRPDLLVAISPGGSEFIADMSREMDDIPYVLLTRGGYQNNVLGIQGPDYSGRIVKGKNRALAVTDVFSSAAVFEEAGEVEGFENRIIGGLGVWDHGEQSRRNRAASFVTDAVVKRYVPAVVSGAMDARANIRLSR